MTPTPYKVRTTSPGTYGTISDESKMGASPPTDSLLSGSNRRSNDNNPRPEEDEKKDQDSDRERELPSMIMDVVRSVIVAVISKKKTRISRTDVLVLYIQYHI
jgi:hypothetical protein